MSDPLMNKTPTNIWKRPFRGWAWLVGSIIVLAGVIFIAICYFNLAIETGPLLWRSLPGMLLLSIVLALLVSAAVLFIRWLCCWRNFRRFLFGVACLITLIALGYAEENWRGRHAWLKHRREWEAKGEKFDLAALAPPPVPAEKNFALTPLL